MMHGTTIKTSENEQNLKQTLAENICFFRKKANLSQIELAKKLNYSNKNISKWELGETTPDVFTLKKLCDIFGITIDTLLTPISSESQTAIKVKKVVPLKWKIYLLCLANALLFLGACITFFCLKSVNFNDFKSQLIFLYILPAMAISVFIFICCVFKKVDWISLSIFGWLMVLCFYVSFISVQNIGYVFIIAIGFQILVPILAVLINSGKLIKLNKLLIKKLDKIKKSGES